jgi:hypothetical protein
MRYVNVMNEHGRRALYRLLRASFDTQLRRGAYWDIDGFFNVSVKQGVTQPISDYGYS